MRIIKATTRDGRTVYPAAVSAAAAATATKPVPAPPAGVSSSLARILRPQAAYRWLLPSVAAITPQYIEATLRGALAGNHVQAWELFDLMEDTWVMLRTCELKFKEAVRDFALSTKPWVEDDEDPTDTAKEKEKLVSSCLRGMRPDPAADENAFSGTVFDILDARFKGIAVLEIDWESRDAGTLGQIVAPRSTYWVHPTCYAFNMDGRLGLRVDQRGALNPAQLSTMSYQPMPSVVGEFPPNKFIIAISKSKSGSALGGALLRPLAWWWCCANFSADWLLNLAQVFGLPFRWATYQTGAPQGTIDAICSMLQNMGSAGWAAFPEGTQLDLKAEGTKSGKETPQGDLIDRADKAAQLLILGQTLTSDTGGSGGKSMALGKVHEHSEGKLIAAGANFVASVINEQIAPAILMLNYGEVSECPVVALEEAKVEDLVEKSTILANLCQAGAGKAIPLSYVNETFNIPKPEPDDETLEAAAPILPPADPNAPQGLDKENAKPGEEQGKDPEPAPPAPAINSKAAQILRRIHQIKDDALFAEALKAAAASL